MERKRNRFINYTIISLIFTLFFLYLLLKYNAYRTKFICALVFLCIAAANFIVFTTLLVSLLVRMHNDKKKKDAFVEAIEKLDKSIFTSFAYDVIEQNFENSLKQDDVIKENVLSYEVAIGYTQNKKPAFYVRLFLSSHDMVYLYCEEEQTSIAYISKTMKVLKGKTLYYNESFSAIDFEERLVNNVRSFLKK